MNILINNKIIEIKIYKKYKDKLLGLMGVKNKINFGIVLVNCNSIHTFFMKQNIDVCITDKNDKIIYLKENLKPNRIIFPVKNGYNTYELPLNSVKYLKLGEFIIKK